MKPKKTADDQLNLFKSRLDQIINMNHPLITLAGKIDWKAFEEAYSGCYCKEFGAPAKAVRLMVGLHYLKHAFNESDESVVAKWVENPYWQYFCGYDYLQHECPIHPTSMTKWRNRVGQDRIELMLKATIDVALDEKYLDRKELKHVNVDTTVQEKNIAYPTDSNLLFKAITKLAKAARKCGLEIRQSYVRVSKKASHRASRFAHAKQFKRMKREIRFLRTRLGRLVRDVEHRLQIPDESIKKTINLCRRLFDQGQNDHDKIYSLHEPEVQCISKGKAHKRYEFGAKVSIATSNKGDWFLAAASQEGNPYDGHTLASTIASVERITGVQVQNAFVDRGYRGHDYEGAGIIHIAGSSSRNLPWSIKKRRRRRSAIEPKIGHAKSENRMGRCFLKGLIGDAINALLAVSGSNLRKLLRGFLFCHFQSLLLLCFIQNKKDFNLSCEATACS